MDDEDDWAYSSDASSLGLDVYDYEPTPQPLAISDRTGRASCPNHGRDHLPTSPIQGPSSLPENYSYGSLNTAKREIQLLEILPHSQSRSICCQVSTYHMDVAPVYIALSYEWGVPDATCTIIVNQSRHTIRQNLYDFLSEVSSAGLYKGCFFWIDAICINQGDDEERSHQVSMMAQIYRTAQCVVAWLGKSTPDSRSVMHTVASQGLSFPSMHATEIWRRLTENHRVAFRTLCSRPYWTRLWIVQELALASECHVMCGTLSLRWETFEAIIEVAEQSKARTLLEVRRVEVRKRINEPRIHGESHACIMRQQIALFRANATLMDHIIACTDLNCDDPLDRVYALLGLVVREYDPITPDYQRDRSALIVLVLQTQYTHVFPSCLEEVYHHCRIMSGILQLPEWNLGWNVAAVLRWASDHQISANLTLAKHIAPCYDPNDLSSVAANGNAAAMAVILNSSQFDVNQADARHSNRTALHRAALGGHDACVALLLQRPHTEVNMADGKGLTALHVACQEGHAALVAMLLDRPDINVNCRSDTGMSPLHLSCKRSHENIEGNLQNSDDVDRSYRNSKRQIPLHDAVKQLLDREEVEINARDIIGRTALHHAAGRGLKACIYLLVRTDVEVNATDEKGWTPLHIAATKDDSSALTALLQVPTIELNVRNADGRTPLHLATQRRHKHSVQSLLSSYGIDANVRDNEGRTPLHLATIDSAIVEQLLERRDVYINARDDAGQTALEYAAMTGRMLSLRAFLLLPGIEASKKHLLDLWPGDKKGFMDSWNEVQGILNLRTCGQKTRKYSRILGMRFGALNT